MIKNDAFQKHLNKVVERDLTIFDLEKIRDQKQLPSALLAMKKGLKFKESDDLKDTIKLTKKLIKLNDYLEISNDGPGDPRELLKALLILLKNR